MHKSLCVVVLALILCPLPCSARTMLGDGDFWKCAVYDSDNKHWTATHSYRITAINRAFESCKKQSNRPKSCKAARESCDAYIAGMNTRPMWQCEALDFFANSFTSNVYRKIYDAAIAARSYCKDNSDYPDSCYVFLIGCQNINSKV